MATGTESGRSFPQPIPQASHRGAPAPNNATAVSPPSRRELASWWKKFRKTTEKDEEKVNTAPGIFGVPLAESIRYANVAISLTNEQGESFIYGYVPIVVAKCGVFLKEKATDVEGIFRLSGSAKRIKDLQTVFNSPDRYGKGLDWTGYTVHDAANILRRYLNQLPEPIVPLEQYERFRDPLRAYQQRLEKHPEGQAPPEITAVEHAMAVTAYQKLITELPALNRQLLLYILDLLAVFSSKSDLNRMTAANLAAIFQPGIISHPIHDMAPQEYRLSQDVLIFLIESQDNFLIGMTGTGLDEKTQKDVESGAPSLKSPKANIGRSASNASAGADSLRKHGLRRNVSVSSHASRERTSPNVSSPGTPASPTYPPNSAGIGVARSNTVPSKRSPAVGQYRFQRVADVQSSGSSAVANGTIQDESEEVVTTPERKTSTPTEPQVATPAHDNVDPQSAQRSSEATNVPFPDLQQTGQPAEAQQRGPNNQSPTMQVPKSQTAGAVQTRDRKISNLFSKSPFLGPSDSPSSQQRQPKKLQKRQRLPGATIESAQSSAASLQGEDPFHTPLMSPDPSRGQTDSAIAAPHASTTNTAVMDAEQHNDLSPPHAQDIQGRGSMAPKSPATSLRSGTSMTDPSDFDALEDPIVKAEKKRNRWRFSSSAQKVEDSPLAPPPSIGQIAGARLSNSSVGSSSRPRQSFTTESQQTQPFTADSSSAGQPSLAAQSSYESYEPPKEVAIESERKGLFGKLKAKMAQSKEERREREAEKERAKSPPRFTGDNASSRQSLSAFAHDHFAPRGRSMDRPRDDVLQPVSEQAKPEAQPSGVGVVAATATSSHPAPLQATHPAPMQASRPAPMQTAAQSQMQAPTHAQIQAAYPATAQATQAAPMQAVAPQTASVTTPSPPPPVGNVDAPSSVPQLATIGTTTAPSPVSPSEVLASVSGQPGPTIATSVMPKAEGEPRLDVNMQNKEMSQPSSVQHTPTEVKGPSLEK